MLLALVLALAGLAAALLRIYSYRAQMLEMARTLEETPVESNLKLTVQAWAEPARRLCRAMNARLEQGRQIRLEMTRQERELKHAMACVSHDIRTPLAGAMGYLQLFEEEPERWEEYLPIVRKRLKELDGLLDQLFLYTRLQSGALPLECRETAAFPVLCDVLAEFYPQLEAAGIQPEVRFSQEDMTVYANPEALSRVYRNLIVNSLRHGGGGLAISAGCGVICFSNLIPTGSRPDPAQLFDRFYQESPARCKSGAGLGLAIVRELMERMEGQVSAEIHGDELWIKLAFRGRQSGPSAGTG